MLKILETLTLDNLQEKIASLLPRGYRFVTMTAVDAGDKFDIYYHFDLYCVLETLYLPLPKDTPLPSISGVCFPAVLVENEIQDLFGIKVTNLAIDYHGHFILAEDAPVKPFCRVPGVGVETIEHEVVKQANGGAL